MRLLLIRHGENLDNVVMARVQLAFDRKLFEKATDGFVAMRKYSTDHSDGKLTSMGKKQAQALGAYWGPIFDEYRRKTNGKIYMYSSPILRAMETAEPLAKQLNIPVVVRPDLAEMPALVARNDRAKWQEEIGKLEYRQQHDKLRKLMKEIQWERCGMTGNEILSKFPTYKLQKEGTNIFNDLEKKWCDFGIESTEKRENRCKRIISWLYDLRDTLNSEDMVIAVGHGGQIGYTLRGLFHNFDQDFAYGSADNTSVTSILMKKPKEEEKAERKRRGLGKRPLTFFGPDTWRRVQMEFNNRVDHLIALLGQNRSLGLFSFPNIVNAATVQQESEDPEYEHIINGYINGLSSKL